VGVFSGWGGAPNGLGGLFRTTNRGATWTKLTGSQFDRVTSITFNPSMPTQAFLTTETQGLWMSSNITAATPTWTLVDSYPFRQPERVYFNPFNVNEMWVSSFGNGMKVGMMNGGSAVPQFSESEMSFSVYPNPCTDFLQIVCSPELLHSGITIHDLKGNLIEEIQTIKSNLIVDTRNWRKGLYILSCNGTAVKVIKK
jgi:hypothetical protein